MSWLRLSSRASARVVGVATVASMGAAVYFIYQRVVLGNPMRMGFNQEGVWAMVPRRQHLEEKVQVRRLSCTYLQCVCTCVRECVMRGGMASSYCVDSPWSPGCNFGLLLSVS